MRWIKVSIRRQHSRNTVWLHIIVFKNMWNKQMLTYMTVAWWIQDRRERGRGIIGNWHLLTWWGDNKLKHWSPNSHVTFFSELSELLESFSAWACPVSGSTLPVWAGSVPRVINKERSSQKQQRHYLIFQCSRSLVG